MTKLDIPNNFEAGLSELEALLKKLETGELSLEEQMTLYEQGTEILKRCEGQLDDIEQKVKVLSNDNKLIDLA